MGTDFRSSLITSSDPRDEPVYFRGGESALFAIFEARHCAACEGTVTTVFVVF